MKTFKTYLEQIFQPFYCFYGKIGLRARNCVGCPIKGKIEITNNCKKLYCKNITASVVLLPLQKEAKRTYKKCIWNNKYYEF